MSGSGERVVTVPAAVLPREAGATPAALGDPPITALVREPEPWPRTLWAAAKSGLLAGSAFAAMMTLMGEPRVIWRGGLFLGAFTAVSEIARRRSRTGEMFPSGLLLVWGAGVAAVGALVGATTVAKGEPTGALMGAFFAGVGTVGVLLGFRKRRAERVRERNLARDAAPATLIPRAEFLRRIEEQQRALTGENRRLVLGALASAGVLGAAVLAQPFLPLESSIADRVGMVLFFGFWASVGGVTLWARRVMRRLAERFGTTCPDCRQPVIGGTGSLRLTKVFEDTGICPQCGVRILGD